MVQQERKDCDRTTSFRRDRKRKSKGIGVDAGECSGSTTVMKNMGHSNGYCDIFCGGNDQE